MKVPIRFCVLFLIVAMLLPTFPAAHAQDCVYQEAPMLAEQVAAGTLPSVCERLPNNPVVIGADSLMPTEFLQVEIGKYSEQMIQAGAWGFEALREPLWISSNLGSELSTGILEVPAANEDNTEFTFKILDGLKWSDGVPVTTEDVRFTIEDWAYNPDLNPSIPLAYLTGASGTGTSAQLEIIDDLTFKFVFDKPYGGFIDQLASNELQGYEILLKPKHYLGQFHIDYADETELKAKVEAEGLTNWYELFNLKDVGPWQAMAPTKIGTPVLNAWVAEVSESDRVVAVRNPYYYAVDAAGNQLPYFDHIVGVSVPEGSSALLMGMSGEVDVSGGGFNDLPLMVENEGDVYTVYRWNDNGSRGFYLNLSKDDPVWQQVVSDIRFRQAINYAIDREEILDDVYAGTGMVTELYPTEYDPDQANALLDEMGVTARDGDGYRLGPDGQSFVIEVDLGPWEEYADPMPLITAYLVDVGIKVDYKQIDPNLMWESMAANQVEGRYDWSRANTWRLRHNHDYLPNDNWGPAWVDWYQSGGAQGIEPPDWIKELYAIHEEIMSVVPDTPEDQAAMDKLSAWYAEYIPVFVVIDGPVYPTMVNNRIGNVPAGGWGHAVPRVWRIFYDKNAQ